MNLVLRRQFPAPPHPAVAFTKALSRKERLAALDSFFQGYLVCALWSSTYTEEDESGEVVRHIDEDYNLSDIAVDSRAKHRNECYEFMMANMSDLLQYAVKYKPQGNYPVWECAGHDFWLTRNGHGVGFWDRGLGELGARLSQASEMAGGRDPYVGDDGKVYLS